MASTFSTTTAGGIIGQSFNSLVAEQCDRFLQALSKVVFSRSIYNVGIVKCFYSMNIYSNKITDFLYLNNPSPSLLIVPLFHENRITLAAFFIPQRKVGFYDSLKKERPESFNFVKYIVEKHFGFEFTVLDQSEINSTINDSCLAEYANFHICRIVEGICFHGCNKLINNFNIFDEVDRIQEILGMIAHPGWRGGWLPMLEERRQYGDIVQSQNVDQDINVFNGTVNESFVVRSEGGAAANVNRTYPVISSHLNGTNAGSMELVNITKIYSSTVKILLLNFPISSTNFFSKKSKKVCLNRHINEASTIFSAIKRNALSEQFFSICAI